MKRDIPTCTARLLTWTPGPFQMIHDLWEHDKHGQPFPGTDSAIVTVPPGVTGPDAPLLWGRTFCPQPVFDFCFQLLKENWSGLLEFPTFVWQMTLPRSLHAQVRVHRHWSYFSESHQLFDVRDFADEGDYFQIPGLTAEQRQDETCAMHRAQDSYRQMRDGGILPSLARGVLPQHINLGLSVQMNLRSLFQTVVMRRCHILQGTYWNPLLESMKSELCTKVDPRFAEFFNLQPCDITGRCLSPIEEELRKGGQDPHAVCSRYEELVRTDNKSSCCGSGCKGCLKSATERGATVERSNKE